MTEGKTTIGVLDESSFSKIYDSFSNVGEVYIGEWIRRSNGLSKIQKYLLSNQSWRGEFIRQLRLPSSVAGNFLL